MFFNLTYFECFFLLRESLLEVFELFGAPEPPGKTCTCVAACCAANAEFKRGLRVEVPKIEQKIEFSVSFILLFIFMLLLLCYFAFLLIFAQYHQHQNHENIDFFSTSQYMSH